MKNRATGGNKQIKQAIKQSVRNEFNKRLYPRAVPHILFHCKRILARPAARKTCWMHFATDFWQQTSLQISLQNETLRIQKSF